MASLLARLGRFSGRHRLVTLFSWLLILAVTAVIAVAGMQIKDGAFDVPGTQSTEAMKVLKDKFPANSDAPTLQLVIESRGASVLDPVNTRVVADAVKDLEGIRGVASVSNPLNPATLYISPDLSTTLVTITFDKLSEHEAAVATDRVASVAANVEKSGLTAEVGGTLASAIPELFGPSEIIGAAIAFLVLMITFRSFVTAGANMLGAVIGVAVGITGTFAFSSIVPVGTLTPILAVMLGLAVGIDYCLFILSRFRSELREGKSVNQAIGRATGTAGSSVAFAGATVIIALAGLSVVGIPFLTEMGLAAAFTVFVAVMMSLTLLPALMSWIGTRVLPRQERDSAAVGLLTGQQRLKTPRWGNGVVRHPVIAIFASVLTLTVVALPLLSMKTSLLTPGGEDPKSTQRAAYNLIADKFGDGSQDPLVVLVRGDNVASSMNSVQSELSDLHDVATVVPSGVSSDGRAGILAVIAKSGPLDEQTKDLVKDIRRMDFGTVSVAVTGSTAVALDSDEQLQSALIKYIVIIVSLSLVLLIILFRSLLVPLMATIGFLLSLGAALGATTAVFQWGWLGGVVQAPQGNPILSLLPIIVTGILFGLAMDYQVFLVSRMHEAYLHGASPKDAVRIGFGNAWVVVAAAAGIMAAVFGGFALSPSSMTAAIALALTAGVVADAFIVRMIFMPAVLSLLGRSAWWLPRWLDRLLPHLDVEGSSLETPSVAGVERSDELALSVSPRQ